MLGYDVWLDYYSLRKGSTFPLEFPKVIQEDSIKFLAVMSPASKSKDNPAKERHLANETKKNIKDDGFIIPIKITKEPISDFYTSNLNWIDFTPYWAKGLNDLVKELEISNVPKKTEGINHSQLIGQEENLNRTQLVEENVFTNLLTIQELPTQVYKLPLSARVVGLNPTVFKETNFCFEITDDLKDIAELCDVAEMIKSDSNFLNVFKSLIQKTINTYILRKGLKHTMDKGFFAFPDNGDSKINYKNLKGRKTYIKTKGHAKTAKYFLSASYTFNYDHFNSPKITIGFKFSFIGPNGRPYAPKLAFKKQMNIRKNLWNEGWLKKILALSSYFTSGNESIDILDNSCGRIKVAGLPDMLKCYHGINDAQIDHDSDISDDFVDFMITEGGRDEQHSSL